MKRVLIIGYGNAAAGDDAVGVRVAEMLRAVSPQADVICAPDLQPELADALAAADRVIFVDASRELPPGRIECRRIIPRESGCLWSHHLGPASLLGLTQAAYGRTPAARLVSIGGRRFGFGEAMSPPVVRAVAAATERISQLL